MPSCAQLPAGWQPSSSASVAWRRELRAVQGPPDTMPFVPIRSAGDLPQELVAHESLLIDFKQDQEPDANYEKAKDVAAFANA